uniref:Putative secreted protein n=1 Tax=Anopheles darlingi TaxID=43151 RepID=A0A2M4DDA3_ANODA
MYVAAWCTLVRVSVMYILGVSVSAIRIPRDGCCVVTSCVFGQGAGIKGKKGLGFSEYFSKFFEVEVIEAAKSESEGKRGFSVQGSNKRKREIAAKTRKFGSVGTTEKQPWSNRKRARAFAYWALPVSFPHARLLSG